MTSNYVTDSYGNKYYLGVPVNKKTKISPITDKLFNAVLNSAPPQANFSGLLPADQITMLKNDVYGDCVLAAIVHLRQITSAISKPQRLHTPPSDDEVTQFWTNWANSNGDTVDTASSDVYSLIDYARRKHAHQYSFAHDSLYGYNSSNPLIYSNPLTSPVGADPTNSWVLETQKRVKEGIFLFGGLLCTLQIPADVSGSPITKNPSYVSYAEMFRLGTWRVNYVKPVPLKLFGRYYTIFNDGYLGANNYPGSGAGYHEVVLCGYDDVYLYGISWGKVFRMDWDFFLFFMVDVEIAYDDFDTFANWLLHRPDTMTVPASTQFQTAGWVVQTSNPKIKALGASIKKNGW